MLLGQLAMVRTMLAECPTWTAEIRQGKLFAVAAVRPLPAVCEACGLVPEHVELNGCPRMRSMHEAMGVHMPAAMLHEEIEPE